MSVWQRNGFTIVPKIGATFSTIGSEINGRAGVSGVNGETVDVDSEVSAWNIAIAAIFGASRPNTKSTWIAQNLIMAIKASAYNSKIIYFLPLLGQDLVGAIQPLRDALAKGAPSNLTGAFGNGDFSESTGLQGNGTTMALNTLIKPSELGASNSGGIGYWENNIDFTGTEASKPSGARNTAATNFFAVQTHSTLSGGFYWGATANRAGPVTGTGTNGHYYGERASATSREIYKDGTSMGLANTTSDATSGASDNNIWVMGFNDTSGTYWKGRCACAYLTDGTMGATNAAAFDTLLRTYLFTPTGRPSS